MMRYLKPKLTWPYPIIKARNDYSKRELRTLFRIAEALRDYAKSDRVEDQIITLAIKDLRVGKEHHYAPIENALKALRGKKIPITGEDEKGPCEFVGSPISQYEFYPEKRKIEIRVSKQVIPAYLALARAYTKEQLNIAFNISYVEVMKFYLALSLHRWREDMRLEVEELRDWVQGEAKKGYRRSSYHLEKIVLKVAAKELKKKADIWFEVSKVIKAGGYIMGWQIKILRRDALTSLPC